MSSDAIRDLFRKGRIDIKHIAKDVLNIKLEIANQTLPEGAEPSEMIANIMLAYRHLEDASMRLGKAIQALEGGESVYDKESTVGA